MKILEMEFRNVPGGVSFRYMVEKLLKRNGVSRVKLSKDWRNQKTVFTVNGYNYIIGESSYIHNYDGIIEFEEFFGKTREINAISVRSGYNTALEGFPQREIDRDFYDGRLDELLEEHRTMVL